MTAEQTRTLHERDAELSQLRPLMEQINSKLREYETKEKVSDNTIQQLEQKVKTKEWVIKNLKEEFNAQRSRESSLIAKTTKLNESIQAYETTFHGKDVDVPMLLIKLKEYVERTQDLEGQVRRLTNKKLNELVLMSRPRLLQIAEEEVVEESGEVPQRICESHQCEASNVECDVDKEDVDSLTSFGTNDMIMYAREGDVLGDLLDSLMCPHRRLHPTNRLSTI
jgi:chromosome segregation ATPase